MAFKKLLVLSQAAALLRGYVSMNLDIPTCGPTKPTASGRPQWEARRTYSWAVVAGIVA